ncbi:MAG: acyl-CoA thioesterase [Ilumatobacteraceae bacterium]
MRTSAEPSLEPADYAFAQRIRVRFAETDAMGIVHHSRYLPYFEEARVAYLRHVGHPYDEVRAAGVEMAVLEAFVQYRKPLEFDDVFDVHVTIASIGRVTFQMAYLVTVGDTAHATGVTVHGCITPDGRATRMPAWLADFAPPA